MASPPFSLTMDDSVSNTTTTATATLLTTFPPISSSPSSSANSCSPSPLPAVAFSPCAACKALRRRCGANCVLVPYFPSTEPLKFKLAHRVFGASNIAKFLQELPSNRRADAVESMVYEANARIKDPVYGCAGLIFQLQKEVSALQGELARAQANCAILQAQHANLQFALAGCMKMAGDDLQQPCLTETAAAASSGGIFSSPCSFQDGTAYCMDAGGRHGGDGWPEVPW
ncbi:LOB domain-containing protein 1-like [Canna indica]|uniref:LOB domain-containing protein 1-like n=1 Tax=Canna indica TaxID=4628 RepID=A0AAQ3K7Y5_9LILI|nr:LOB domain-containing protein 1-like [Canna indica]